MSMSDEFVAARRRIAIDHELTIKQTGDVDLSTTFEAECQCGWQKDSNYYATQLQNAHELHLDRLTYARIEATEMAVS